MEQVLALADAALDVPAMIDACQAAVRIPSLSYQEGEIAAFLVERLLALGIEGAGTDPHGNVVAILRGSGGAPSLMINGHIDHVPPGDMPDAFSGAIVDGTQWGHVGPVIFGRGSCDMKCNVVASAYALGALQLAGIRLKGDVIFVADVQEEIDSPLGVKAVIESGLRADFGLSTESTGCRTYLGHRGKLEFAVEVKGRTSHASEPGNGVNAIYEALPIVEAIRNLSSRLPNDCLFGPATVTVTSLRSSPDNDTALVPDRCLLRVDRRYVRGESPASCEAELLEVLSAVSTSQVELRADLRLTNHYPLMAIDPENSLVSAAQQAIADFSGEAAPSPGAWRFGVNGTFMSAAGIPTIGLGPGDERWAHTREEHVPVADLERAARIWMRLIVHLCGIAGEDETGSACVEMTACS